MPKTKAIKKANGTGKGRQGMPRFVPTDDQRALVQNCIAFGLTHEQITTLVPNGRGRPIGLTTLWQAFRKELDQGLPAANAQIANSLFQAAKSGNVTAQIFWLKTRAHWKETNVYEVGGKDGGPVEVTVDAHSWLHDTLDQMESRIRPEPRRANGAERERNGAPPAAREAAE